MPVHQNNPPTGAKRIKSTQIVKNTKTVGVNHHFDPTVFLYRILHKSNLLEQLFYFLILRQHHCQLGKNSLRFLGLAFGKLGSDHRL